MLLKSASFYVENENETKSTKSYPVCLHKMRDCNQCQSMWKCTFRITWLFNTSKSLSILVFHLVVTQSDIISKLEWISPMLTSPSQKPTNVGETQLQCKTFQGIIMESWKAATSTMRFPWVSLWRHDDHHHHYEPQHPPTHPKNKSSLKFIHSPLRDKADSKKVAGS